MNKIFDRDLVLSRKGKAREFLGKSEIFEYITKDIIDRASSLGKNFKNILNLEGSVPFAGKYLKENFPDALVKNINSAAEKIEAEEKFDLIIYPFGLHWVNDAIGFLSSARSSLSEGGIFLCNFAGENSLKNLRRFLAVAEELYSTKHFPHISPFVKFSQTTELAKAAGFAEIVADYEIIELEYSSPLALARAIKKVGESNALLERGNYSISKKILNYMESEGNFIDKINLISLLGTKKKGALKGAP